MKVLVVGSNSVHLSNFITGISRMDVKLSFLSEEKCDFWKEEMFLLNFRSLNPISLLNNYRQLKNVLQINHFDVIHIHQANRLAYFVTKVASKLKTKVVLTAWGSDVLIVPKKSFFHKFLVTQTLKRSFLITADAKIMIDAMLRMESEIRKYVHLQYGIDAVEPKGKEQIIFSNRLHKSFYNIDKIIIHFAAFSKDHPDWKLIIAGSGSETENLKHLVQDLKLTSSINFVGWLGKEENNNWYAKSRIYCSIPESDGTSVSVLESMSAECLPVLSDIPVSHEWVENKINGVILQGGINPFDVAFQMDMKKAININRDLINKKAIREMCMTEFYAIYFKAKSK